MAKDDEIVVEGTVTEMLPSTMFRVRLENDEEIICYLAGRMRKFRVKVITNDRVVVELSPYDLSKGRIVKRL